MADRSSFESHEWGLLSGSPRWIHLALIAARGGEDEIETDEAKAMAEFLGAYETESQLIKDVLEDNAKLIEYDEEEGPQAIVSLPFDMVEKKLVKIGTLLKQKVEPEEAESFREFLNAMAQNIAEAVSEGFLGFGDSVSEEESGAFEKISVALQGSDEESEDLEPPEIPEEAAPEESPAEVEEAAAEQEEGGERIYEVQSGDTLSKIALEFYGKASAWTKIVAANSDQIDNPDIIHPGQTFRIP